MIEMLSFPFMQRFCFCAGNSTRFRATRVFITDCNYCFVLCAAPK